MLSASQLGLLGWGGATPTAARRLRLLHDAGLLDRFRPPAAAGSFEWNSMLSAVGWEQLVALGALPEKPAFAPIELHSIAYGEHDLQCNTIVLAIARACTRGTGGLLARMPFRWRARSVRLTNPRSEPLPIDDDFVDFGRSLPGAVMPDALLEATDQDGHTFAVLIEYDRTRRASKQVARLRRYDRFLTAGWRSTELADPDVPPVLLYVGEDERRRDGLVEAATDGCFIAKTGAATTEMRRPRRESTLFATRDQLLAGDWRMRHLDAPNGVTYDLPTIIGGPTAAANVRTPAPHAETPAPERAAEETTDAEQLALI